MLSSWSPTYDGNCKYKYFFDKTRWCAECLREWAVREPDPDYFDMQYEIDTQAETIAGLEDRETNLGNTIDDLQEKIADARRILE